MAILEAVSGPYREVLYDADPDNKTSRFAGNS
jgi:hypothetical protein